MEEEEEERDVIWNFKDCMDKMCQCAVSSFSFYLMTEHYNEST